MTMNTQTRKNPASTMFLTASADTVRTRDALNPSSFNSLEIPMFTKIRKLVIPSLLALIAGTAALTPVCAHADDFAPHSIRVSLADLNQNSAEGARKVYSRIESAAWTVCGESSMDIEVMYRHGPSDCVKEALAHAVRDARSAELAQLYIKKNGAKIAKQYNVSTDILVANK
jgi:UrcA family protein